MLRATPATTRCQQVDREILLCDTMSVLLLVFVSVFFSLPFIFYLSFFSIFSSSSFSDNGMICKYFINRRKKRLGPLKYKRANKSDGKIMWVIEINVIGNSV